MQTAEDGNALGASCLLLLDEDAPKNRKFRPSGQHRRHPDQFESSERQSPLLDRRAIAVEVKPAKKTIPLRSSE
jgi:hypothetical protein